MDTLYDYTVKVSGKDLNLADYKGKVVLAVNVASECGFTKQYGGLEELYKKYKDQDFEIIGFPCNQFGGQEPGENEEIKDFCVKNHGVTFTLADKIDVNGDKEAYLYKWMKESQPGILGLKRIKWNFEKFLINRRGKVVKRFASTTEPKSIAPEIEKLLQPDN